MKKHLGWLLSALLLFSVTIISWKPVDANQSNTSFFAKGLFEKYISNIYESAHLQESGLELSVFEKAVTGFINLKIANKIPQNSSVLTVVDLGRPSTEKRMWIVDILSKELLLNTLVAHGQGSGDDMATQFSDLMDSHQSSLGFYLTDDVYYGKNGLSLRLDGMDEGFNVNARERAIVVHGAGYVSQGTIDVLGRLGRSYGCPAVPTEVADQVINTIKNKTVMFINGNNDLYNSKYLDEDSASNFVSQNNGDSYIANL